MSSDIPIINKAPFTMDPFVPKSEQSDHISLTSSIPQLLSFLKCTFQDQDFASVQENLVGREKSVNLELQKLRRTVELLEKKIALYDLEDLHKQERLKDSLNRCKKWEEEKRVLCEENLRVQEKLELLEKNQALYNLENLKKEEQLQDYLNKCVNMRGNVARLEEEKRVLCEKSLRIEERYKKINDDFVEEQKEKTKLLFERIEELKREKSAAEENVRAYEKKFIELNNRVSRLEEEMNVSIIRNLDLKDGVIDSPPEAKSVCHSTGNSCGKEPLPIQIIDDNDEITNGSHPMPKRKRSMSESEDNDKPNGLSKGSDLKWLSTADMCSAFESNPDICVDAVCALYRQQISGNDSSTGFSCSEIDEKSITILGQYLTDGDHKLKRKAADIKPFHEMCKELAIRHCHQLFQLYQS